MPIELSIDYGADTTAVTVCQDAPHEYRIIGEVELHDTMPEEVVVAVRTELIGLGDRTGGATRLETQPGRALSGPAAAGSAKHVVEL